jgi:hypothetical protein
MGNGKRRSIQKCGGSMVACQQEAGPPYSLLLPALKNSPDQIQAPLDGAMPPGFPVLNRGRVNTQLLGHLPLRQAKRPARGDKTFRQCVGRGLRFIPE